MNFMQFFQDSTGANSNMRLMVTLVVVAIIGTWLVANMVMAWQALKGHGSLAIVPMDANMIWALGVALGAKTAQAVVENKTDNKDPVEQK